MKRSAIEFTDYKQFPMEPVDGAVSGLSQRIISRDEKGQPMVRIFEFAPGTDTTPNGVQTHDYWEEVFIVEGSMIDLSLNQEFSKGFTASRPPGMRHGPWKSPNGCVTFEVTYHLD